ncbi:hypothetical protein V8E51_014398 [Hyaloscypha variabilis]
MPKGPKLTSGLASSAKVKSSKKSAKFKQGKAKATMASQSTDPYPVGSATELTRAALDFESEAVHTPELDPNAPFSKTAHLFDANSRTIILLVSKEETKLAIHQTILWMYRHDLCFPASFNTASVSINDSLDTAPGLLARLFVLAEKYQITRLQNDIIDAFLVWLDDFSLNHMIPASVIQYVWTNTISEDCLLRKFLVDYANAHYEIWDMKAVKDLIEEKEFWHQLSRKQALMMQLVRDVLDEEEGGLVDIEAVRVYAKPDLLGDVCKCCEVLKRCGQLDFGYGIQKVTKKNCGMLVETEGHFEHERSCCTR